MVREVREVALCEHDKETPAMIPGVIIHVPGHGTWQIDPCQEHLLALNHVLEPLLANAREVTIGLPQAPAGVRSLPLAPPFSTPTPAGNSPLFMPPPELDGPPVPRPVSAPPRALARPEPESPKREPEPVRARPSGPALPKGMVWKPYIATAGAKTKRTLHAGWPDNRNGRCRFVLDPNKWATDGIVAGDYCKQCLTSTALDLKNNREPVAVSKFD